MLLREHNILTSQVYKKKNSEIAKICRSLQNVALRYSFFKCLNPKCLQQMSKLSTSGSVLTWYIKRSVTVLCCHLEMPLGSFLRKTVFILDTSVNFPALDFPLQAKES